MFRVSALPILLFLSFIIFPLSLHASPSDAEETVAVQYHPAMAYEAPPLSDDEEELEVIANVEYSAEGYVIEDDYEIMADQQVYATYEVPTLADEEKEGDEEPAEIPSTEPLDPVTSTLDETPPSIEVEQPGTPPTALKIDDKPDNPDFNLETFENEMVASNSLSGSGCALTGLNPGAGFFDLGMLVSCLLAFFPLKHLRRKK